MKIHKILFSAVLLSFIPLNGVITESSTIESVLPIVERYKDKKVLVAFDVDNTLVYGKDLFSRVEYFYKKGEALVSAGIQLQDVRHYLYNDWTFIMYNSLVCLVEQKSLEVLKTLREKNIAYIGLTSRPMYVAQQTINQLAQVGVTFNMSYKETMLIYGNDLLRPSIYLSGVIFTDIYMNKDQALSKFFERTGYNPDVVIVIDDSKNVLPAIENKMTEEGKIFEGIRFSGRDKAVETFDLKKAEEDYIKFKKSHSFVIN